MQKENTELNLCFFLQNNKVKKMEDGVECHFTLELLWDHF